MADHPGQNTGRHTSPQAARFWWSVAAVLILLAIATPLDSWLYHALLRPEAERSDAYQLFRSLGYLPMWIGVALAITLAEHVRAVNAGRRNTNLTPDPRTIGIVTFVAPAFAGLIAELVKLVSGRMRPHVGDGAYVFKPFLSGFIDGSNLGFASSHAAVAMGGAAIVAWRYPGSGWVLVPAAIGCGVTRLLGGAHFATDVIAGLGIGALVAWWLRESVMPAKPATIPVPRVYPEPQANETEDSA